MLLGEILSRRMSGQFIRAVALCACALCGIAVAAAGEVIHADGRREAAEGLRQTSAGIWTAQVGSRRVALKPGIVVVVIEDSGKETVTIPPLSDAPASPQSTAALARVQDARNKAWMQAASALGEKPARAVHDALVELTSSKRKELRGRAVHALTMLRTRESVAAAAKAVAAEKDRKLRREAASALLSVREIVTRADAAESVKAGLADKDKSVRVIFALLAAEGDATALAVLEKDGIGHSDHHFRESAAIELAHRGSAAGEPILIKMLQRKRIPGLEDAGPELATRQLVREHVEICRLLGKLETEKGKAALEIAKKSPHELVRKAATKALETWPD